MPASILDSASSFTVAASWRCPHAALERIRPVAVSVAAGEQGYGVINETESEALILGPVVAGNRVVRLSAVEDEESLHVELLCHPVPKGEPPAWQVELEEKVGGANGFRSAASALVGDTPPVVTYRAELRFDDETWESDLVPRPLDKSAAEKALLGIGEADVVGLTVHYASGAGGIQELSIRSLSKEYGVRIWMRGPLRISETLELEPLNEALDLVLGRVLRRTAAVKSDV